MRMLLDWAEQQFRALQRPDARGLAIDLVSAYEGSALLSEPDLMLHQARRLEKRIEALWAQQSRMLASPCAVKSIEQQDGNSAG